MSKPRRTFLLLATLVAGGAGGFFLGRLQPLPAEDSASKKVASSLAKYRTPEDKPAPARESKTASELKTQKPSDILRLPKSVVDRFWVHFEFQKSGFVPGGLGAFGIPIENHPPMKAAIDDAVKQIRDLEIASSELTPDGGFRIKPFPADGAAIREKLLAALHPYLEGFDDDRAAVLERSLTQCEAFKNFGKIRTEIHFKEVKGPDGQSEWQGTEDVDYLSGISDKRSGFGPHSDSLERLKRLMAKHIP